MNLQIYLGESIGIPLFLLLRSAELWCVYSEINFINLTVEFDSRMAFPLARPDLTCHKRSSIFSLVLNWAILLPIMIFPIIG